MAPTTPDRDRIARLLAALETAWGPAADAAPVEIVRAPGRVNLIGDHTEHNEGFVLPVAIELDTWIAVRPRQDGLVRIVSRHSSEVGSFRIEALELAPGRGGPGGTAAAGAAAAGPGNGAAAAAGAAAAGPGNGAAAAPGGPSGGWSDYVAGTAWSLREAALPVRGFVGVVDTTIPIGAGLASSAALEVASALALLGGGSELAAPSLAALAQRGERDYVGVDCGFMDQFASAAGRADRALLLDCRSLDTRYVSLPHGLRVVVCDTGSRREGGAASYLTRRAECARALALLAERMPGLCSIRDLNAATLRRHRGLLPENVARRAEHVVSENARVLATVTALEAGDLDQLARLFAESHASLRDLYEVGSPALDTMVEVAREIPGVVAARMTGAGFGGCTVNLVLADAVPALQAAVGREYDSRTGLKGRAYPVTIVDGAGPVQTT
ncbi:MAG: galactokinase [Candidatus Limnocylindrales bacterium]